MSAEHIPNNLRHYRKQAGLRQIDVARILRLECMDRLSHWENGAAVPSVVNLFKLCAIYKATPQDLYEELYKTIRASAVKDPPLKDQHASVA